MNLSVSVIITCFNLERYIGAAIRSALAQQLDRPFEVIVVDDHSTDRSRDIIRSFDGVRCVQAPRNSGVLLAMLEGIRAAQGELLFFLDGDDLWEEGKLSACVKAFEADPACVLVTHDLCFIDEHDQLLDRTSRPREALDSLPAGRRGPAVLDAILHHRDFVWLGSAFGVRRSLGQIDQFDAWARALPDPANTYQDWPLAFWAAALPDVTVTYVPHKLFRYRLHRANHSGDASSAGRAARNFLRARNTLEAMYDLAKARNLPASILRTLRSRGRAYDYLASLYLGQRVSALKGFPGAAPDFFRRGELAKELARLLGVLLIGPQRFAQAAAGR